jgi:hypothetical protein
MKLPILSASKRGLLSACQYPWSPRAPAWDETSGSAAVAGTKFHRIAECYVRGIEPDVKMPKPLSSAWPHMRDWIDAHREGLRSEVAYGCDLASAFVHEVAAAGRAYPALPNWAYGTADLVTPDSVDDIKTGREKDDDIAQLRLLVAIRMKADGLDVCNGRLLYVGEYGIKPVAVRLNLADMEAELATLRILSRDIPEAWPQPGAWCYGSWCPVRSRCEVAERRPT